MSRRPTAKLPAAAAADPGEGHPFLAQHLALARRRIDTADGPIDVLVNDAESPLAWLARRKGRDGRPLIEPVQLQAGERLRRQFTRAQMMPRVTANWNAPVAQARRGADGSRPGAFAEATLAARQQLRTALEAVGPEFAGLLLDVCCFLKSLEDVEGERGWPARSAKVVLRLGLDRLARHFGLSGEVRGRARAAMRSWPAPDGMSERSETGDASWSDSNAWLPGVGPDRSQT